MYVPKSNEENNIAVLHALMREKPLGTWAAIADGEIEVNHIPFVIKEKKESLGPLFAMLPKQIQFGKLSRRYMTLSLRFTATKLIFLHRGIRASMKMAKQYLRGIIVLFTLMECLK